MAEIRIFSYLPNPRVAKATITGRLNGVDVEVVGTRPGDLKDWLWDFDARPLTLEDRHAGKHARIARTGFSGELFKTDRFMMAHPYGTVPAAFSGDGKVGIFESNSIMRAVARLGNDKCALYGKDAFSASRIDSFLDTALLFARDAQIYLLALGDEQVSDPIFEGAMEAYGKYLSGVDLALRSSDFIAGDDLSIADIGFACELCLFGRELAASHKLARTGRAPISAAMAVDFPAAAKHFDQLITMPGIIEDLGPLMDKLEQDIRARQV